MFSVSRPSKYWYGTSNILWFISKFKQVCEALQGNAVLSLALSKIPDKCYSVPTLLLVQLCKLQCKLKIIHLQKQDENQEELYEETRSSPPLWIWGVTPLCTLIQNFCCNLHNIPCRHNLGWSFQLSNLITQEFQHFFCKLWKWLRKYDNWYPKEWQYMSLLYLQQLNTFLL